MVYTDDAGAYKGMPFDHESVRHSVGEYVSGMAHTNGIESFWSMLKRAHKGVYHKISPKHLQRYVDEFSGRHGVREADTITQMAINRCWDGWKAANVQRVSGRLGPPLDPDLIAPFTPAKHHGTVDGRHHSRSPSTVKP